MFSKFGGIDLVIRRLTLVMTDTRFELEFELESASSCVFFGVVSSEGKGYSFLLLSDLLSRFCGLELSI